MISVIVPVYKVEKYLPECIESILGQTYRDFELILVDDGSPDSSGKICDEYAQRDNCIRVIHLQNGGVTRARAAGVEKAQGEWICFVDGDDTIPKDSLETLMSATGSMTDIIIAKFDDRKLLESMTLEEYRRDCIAGRKVQSGPFARAFRASLFSSHIFDIPREVVRGEDLIMNVRLAFETGKKPVLVDKKVYYYRHNESSVMHRSVHTLEHAELFHHHLALSIPDTKKYVNEIISNKIRSVINVIYDNPSDRSWRKSDFWSKLKEEMSANNYKMNIEERLMLMAWDKLSLRVFIKLTNLFHS